MFWVAVPPVIGFSSHGGTAQFLCMVLLIVQMKPSDYIILHNEVPVNNSYPSGPFWDVNPVTFRGPAVSGFDITTQGVTWVTNTVFPQF